MSNTPAKCFNGQNLENLVNAADALAKAAAWMSNPNDGKTGYDGTALRKALADYEGAREIKRESITEVYGIMGLKGHGKDHFATLVRSFNSDFTAISMAKPLKDQAKEIWGLTDAQMYDLRAKEAEFKVPVEMDLFLDEMRKITGLDIQPANMVAKSARHILQFYGTEYVRKASPTYWTDKVVEYILTKGGKVLIPDIRFQNEVDVLKSLGGKVIRIQRLDLPDPDDMHPSEQEGKAIVPDLLLGTLWSQYTIQEEAAKRVAENAFDTTAELDYRTLPELLLGLIGVNNPPTQDQKVLLQYYWDRFKQQGLYWGFETEEELALRCRGRMLEHSWQEVGDTEWCCQCGTSRTAPLPEWSTETGDVVQIRTYFQVGEQPLKIVEGKGSTDCQVLSSHVSRAIGAWLNLKEQNGKATRGYSFHVDAKHSSLLHRFLTGGPVFKEAPPVAYNYPWVELLVNKRDDNLHMVKEHQYGGKGPSTLLINQVSWTILDKLGPAEWIVTYSVPDLKACAQEASSGGNCYASVWAKTKWRVWRSGTRPDPNPKWQLSEEQAAIWSIELFEGTVPETFETSGKRVLY